MVELEFEAAEEGEEDEEEATRDEHNMMNNSLLQVYCHDNTKCTSSPISHSSDILCASSVSGSHSCGHGIGPEHFSVGLLMNAQIPLNWDEDELDDDQKLMLSDDTAAKSETLVLLGSDGNPIDEVDSSTTTPGHVTHHMTSDSSHVTRTHDHVVAGSDGGERQEVLAEGGGGCVTLSGDSGECVRLGRVVEEGRVMGAESEERRKVKKVTFAPEVMDNKQKSSVLKVYYYFILRWQFTRTVRASIA